MDLLIQQELATIHAVVMATQVRVEKIGTKQDVLALAVMDLTVSVDNLKKSVAGLLPVAQQQNSDEIERMKQMLTDTCEQLGGSVVNMHRDFAVLTQHLGPAFAQVDKAIAPFQEVIETFTAPLARDGSESG